MFPGYRLGKQYAVTGPVKTPREEQTHNPEPASSGRIKPDKNHEKNKKNYLVEIGAATCSTLDLMTSTRRVG